MEHPQDVFGVKAKNDFVNPRILESCGKHTGDFFVERSVKTQDFLWEILYPVVKNMGTSIQRINTGYRTDSKTNKK